MKTLNRGLLTTTTVVDFANLKGSFGNPKAVPSDLDGIVCSTNPKDEVNHVAGILERRGNFLVIECKHPGDPELSIGQRIMLEQFAKLPNFVVLVVMLSGKRYDNDTGCPGPLKFEPKAYKMIGRDTRWRDTDTEKFNRMCKAWWQKVNRKSKR